MGKIEKRNIIQKNFYKLKNNFNNGIKEYKNFGVICSILDINYSKASNDSKKFIINELNRYCDCGYKGKTHTFEIREIYDEPKKIEVQTRNYRSVYGDSFYSIIVAMLYDKRYSNIIMNNNIIATDRYDLFNAFGLTNDWFYKPAKLDKLEEDIYNELRSSIYEIVHQGFKRGLDYLKRKKKIEYSKCSKIHYLNKPSADNQLADNDEEDIIQGFKQNILEENYCASEHAFVEEYGFDYFKELLNEELKEYKFEYLKSVYKIELINCDIEKEYNNIYGEMSTAEIQEFIREKRLIINQRVLGQLPTKNEYDFNTAYSHSTFKGTNYKERKNNIIDTITAQVREKTPQAVMLNRQEIKDYYFAKRNEFAKQIIEIN